VKCLSKEVVSIVNYKKDLGANKKPYRRVNFDTFCLSS